MKVGIRLPQWGATATRANLVAVAQDVEQAGLDSVWIADHVVYPTHGSEGFPTGGPMPFAASDGILEAFTALTLVAAVTERVTVGTSVLVLPMRNTVLTAKTAATLDVLAEGRLVLGVGAGWWEAEFEALGASFSDRGARFDEQIEALRQLWGEGTAEYAGAHVRFDAIACEPRPLRPGGPSLLVGGMGRAARARAGRLGDGWHAVGSHAPTLRAGMDDVCAVAEAAGRDPSLLHFSTAADMPTDADHALRRLLRLGDAGIDEVVLEAGSHDPDGIRRHVEMLAARVLPRLADASLTRAG